MTLVTLTYSDGKTETLTLDVLLSRCVGVAVAHQQWLDATHELLGYLASTLPPGAFSEAVRPFFDRDLIKPDEAQQT